MTRQELATAFRQAVDADWAGEHLEDCDPAVEATARGIDEMLGEESVPLSRAIEAMIDAVKVWGAPKLPDLLAFMFTGCTPSTEDDD